MSGILMNDATDNLPIFVVIKGETRTNKDKKTEILSRRKTEESVMSFKRDLINQDWKEVYVEDVNDSYNSFLSILTDIYNKNCQRSASITVSVESTVGKSYSIQNDG